MTDQPALLDLAQAKAVIDGVFAKAAEVGCRPLTAAVVDAGGHLLALHRQDGSPPLVPRVVQGKAGAAIGFNTNSRHLAGLAERSPNLVGALVGMTQGVFVPVPGGVLIKDAGGRTLGAVGVGGDTPDNDEICAKAGIAAAGLNAAD